MTFLRPAARALACLLCLTSTVAAAPRTWRNADGTGSFTGEYLRHDAQRVTIRRSDGRVFTLELAKLHPDDRSWLLQRDAGDPSGSPPIAGANAVFDSLQLGDPQATVRQKLAGSKVVELTVDESWLGRLGLNGTYRTRQQIGGQHCRLFFDWAPAGDGEPRMRELSLRTEPADAADYPTRLRATWSEFVTLLAALHGPPVSAGEFPLPADLTTDGMFLPTHLWRLAKGHSAMLGAARDGGRFSVVVMFTTDAIEPVRHPADVVGQQPPPPVGG